MNNNKPHPNLIEILILGLTVCLFSFFGIKYSIFFAIFMILAAIPVAVITIRHKEVWALITCLAVFLVEIIIFNVTLPALGFIAYTIAGISIGYCLRNKISLKKSVIVGGVSYIVIFMLCNLLTYKIWGINIIQQGIIVNIDNMLELNRENILKFAQSQGANPELIYAEVFNKMNGLFVLIPALLTIVSIIISYVVIVITNNVMNRFKNSLSYIEPFSEFRLPAGVGMAFLIAQIITWDKNIDGGNVDKFLMVFSNLVWVLAFGFMIQGLALVDFWLKRFGLVGTLRSIVYVLGGFILLPFIFLLNIPIILILVGVLDYVMDFRKLEAR